MRFDDSIKRGDRVIEPVQYEYKLILMTENGKQYDISGLVHNLGWEELKKELAARITFTAKNDKTSKGRLSSLAKPGCYVGLLYSYKGGKSAEAVRGKIIEWNPSAKLSSENLKIKAYDDLYDMQESQDDIYFSSGIGTKSAISKIFSSWKIPLGKYTGPDVTHGKLRYNNEKLGTAVVKILEEAKKKGGSEAFVRAVKGKAQVLSYGGNEKVYHFEENVHLTSIFHKVSTAGMVTRVKVLGEEDDDDRRPVEATVDGKTKYGIRQKTYTRGSDESLDDAKKAAKDILSEDGVPDEEITIKSPDVPVVRKGDMIHLKASTISTGYYNVLSIIHDCDEMEMTMTIKKAVIKSGSDSSKKQKKKDYSIGDIVNFHGGTHYVSSYASSGYSVGPGKAKIAHTNPGSPHPWSLITENWAETHVWGWVDDGTFD